jgi:hypothetical protein
MKLSRRKLLIGASLLPLMKSPADAYIHGSGGLTQFNTLKVGGGGRVTWFSAADDGTLFCRTDSAVAYKLNRATSTWVPVITDTSIGTTYLQTMKDSGVTVPYVWFDGGIYDLQVAPSDSTIVYAFFYFDLFRSSNGGTTFGSTVYPTIGGITPINGDTTAAYNAAHIAIDPNNSSVVYASDRMNIYFSPDGFTSTYSQLNSATIPNAGSSDGYSIIFDRYHTTTVGGQTRSKNVYVASWGNQILVSTDGGQSFSAMSGGPTNIASFAIGNDGTLWAINNKASAFAGGNSNVWSWNGTSWKQWTLVEIGQSSSPANAQPLFSVAVPLNAASPVVCAPESGQLNVYNGSTWSGLYSFSVTATDVPWLANTVLNAGWIENIGLLIDPLDSTKVWNGAGIGAFYSAVPSGSFSWTSLTAGIENLVGSDICSPPTATYPDPVLASWDKPIWVVADPTAYQSNCVLNGFAICGCAAIDYASSDPTFLAVNSSQNNNDQSGYSTNGGSTWTAFATLPIRPQLNNTAVSDGSNNLYFDATALGKIAVQVGQTVQDTTVGTNYVVASLPTGGTLPVTTTPSINSTGRKFSFYGGGGGAIAVSTANNIIVLPSCAQAPLLTQDGGNSWAPITSISVSIPTTHNTNNGWGDPASYSVFNRNHVVAAQRGNTGVFYIYNDLAAAKGVYKSSDGGSTWSQIFNGYISGTPQINQQLSCPPIYSGAYNTSGHLFYSDCLVQGSSTDGLSFAIDSGGSLSWTTVTDQNSQKLVRVKAFGFGAPKPGGNGYPTIYAMGQFNGAWGYWRGDNFNPLTAQATWTQIGPNPWANDNIQLPNAISGDANVYGKVYIAFAGSGYAYGVLH